MYKLFFQLFSQGVVWLALLLLILMALLPDITFMLIGRHFHPSETQKVQVTVLRIFNVNEKFVSGRYNFQEFESDAEFKSECQELKLAIFRLTGIPMELALSFDLNLTPNSN